MSVLFHPLRVSAIEPDTAEAVIVSFAVPPELRETFGFTQGQYLTLRADIGGEDLRRSYSICAGIDDGELRVGVRRVGGGASKEQFFFTLTQAGEAEPFLLRMDPRLAITETDREREFVLIQAMQGVVPAPEAMWVGWPETPAGGLALEGSHLLRERVARAMSEPAPSDASVFTRTVSDLQQILPGIYRQKCLTIP